MLSDMYWMRVMNMSEIENCYFGKKESGISCEEILLIVKMLECEMKDNCQFFFDLSYFFLKFVVE